MQPEYPLINPLLGTLEPHSLRRVLEQYFPLYLCLSQWTMTQYLQLIIKLPLEPSPPITSMLPSNFRSGGGPAFLGLPG